MPPARVVEADRTRPAAFDLAGEERRAADFERRLREVPDYPAVQDLDAIERA